MKKNVKRKEVKVVERNREMKKITQNQQFTTINLLFITFPTNKLKK